jgi:hypothetical protein
MKYQILGLSILFTILYSKTGVAQFGLYAELDSFSHSEPVSIFSALDDWDGPFYGGDQQWSYNWAEIGFSYSNWGLGLVNRLDYQFDFSNETAEIYYLTANKKDLPADRDFPVYIDAHHFEGSGLRLSYKRQAISRLNIELGLSYLEGKRLTAGTLTGNITTLSNNDFDFIADVDYFYSKDHLFDRPVSGPKGSGFSIDLAFDYQFSDRLQFEGTVQDAWAEVRWKNAPFTQASAQPSTKRFDEDGYVTIDPRLTGLEGNRNYTQKLPMRTKLSLAYEFWRSTQAVFKFWDMPLERVFAIGIAHSWNRHKLSAFYWPQLGALGLGLNLMAGRFILAITSDHIEIDKARTLGIRVFIR